MFSFILPVTTNNIIETTVSFLINNEQSIAIQDTAFLLLHLYNDC